MQESYLRAKLTAIKLTHRETGEDLELTPDTQWRTLEVQLTQYAPDFITLKDGREVELEYDGESKQDGYYVYYYTKVKGTLLEATLTIESRPIHGGMRLSIAVF